MLAISFFALIFSSLLWFIYSLRFIFDNLKGISFFDAGLANVLLYTLLVCLPIFLVWMVFAFINQYLSNRNFGMQMQKLFQQMKKNQDYSDLLARVMIETEQQVKDGFVLNRFDLLIADMNELLSEIIRGCKLASGEQIENLWNKVQNGGKWSFGKVIIEVNNTQPNFQMRIYERSIRDGVVGGTIMEFCARYLAVVKMLEKHDQDKVFLNMIETGVMGKVFSILSPVAEEIRRSRESKASFVRHESEQEQKPRPQPHPVIRPAPQIPEPKPVNEPQKNIFDRFKGWKRKKEEPETPLNRDPFSIALERSFGEEDKDSFEDSSEPKLSSEKEDFADEPRFEISPPAEFNQEEISYSKEEPEAKEDSVPVSEPEEISDTQKMLDSLKKEWENFPIAEKANQDEPKETENKSPTISEENLAYPFGGWVDEQNYNK